MLLRSSTLAPGGRNVVAELADPGAPRPAASRRRRPPDPRPRLGLGGGARGGLRGARGAQHPQRSNACNDCHTTNAWRPSTFRHTSAAYPGDHRRGLDCRACHPANSPQVAYAQPAYRPDCAGCHAPDFKTGPHKKVDTPRISYTVSELRDCSGACHQYTDPSLTTIKKRRSGEHRVSDGDF